MGVFYGVEVGIVLACNFNDALHYIADGNIVLRWVIEIGSLKLIDYRTGHCRELRRFIVHLLLIARRIAVFEVVYHVFIQSGIHIAEHGHAVSRLQPRIEGGERIGVVVDLPYHVVEAGRVVGGNEIAVERCPNRLGDLARYNVVPRFCAFKLFIGETAKHIAVLVVIHFNTS